VSDFESERAGACNPHNWIASAERLRRSSLILWGQWQADLEDMRSLAGPWSPPSWLLNREPAPPVLGPEAAARMELVAEWAERRQESTGAAAVLLLGYALENLVKGLLIAQDQTHWVRDDADRPERLFRWDEISRGGHLSSAFFERAGVVLTGAQRDALKMLEKFIQWGGRYPASLDARDMVGGATHSDHEYRIAMDVFGQTRLKLEATLRATDRPQ
jgi:hypothetical protein